MPYIDYTLKRACRKNLIPEAKKQTLINELFRIVTQAHTKRLIIADCLATDNLAFIDDGDGNHSIKIIDLGSVKEELHEGYIQKPHCLPPYPFRAIYKERDIFAAICASYEIMTGNYLQEYNAAGKVNLDLSKVLKKIINDLPLDMALRFIKK